MLLVILKINHIYKDSNCMDTVEIFHIFARKNAAVVLVYLSMTCYRKIIQCLSSIGLLVVFWVFFSVMKLVVSNLSPVRVFATGGFTMGM